MILRFWPTIFLLMAVAATALGQSDSLTYQAPLAGPLLVTGTFGELRSDHFHAGLDFRAATNTPVMAVADGYVSRIVISPGGFGQAVYVDHPDGYRSVYAHLETLSEVLLDTIRARQFAEEAFRQNLRFDSLAFPIRAGDRIGGVGNRGHSFGPHLHFEMRKQAGDVAVNPLAFGFDVADTRRPQIRDLRVYELDGHGLEHYPRDFKPERRRDGTYYIKDTIQVGRPGVGFALKAYDRQNGMPNWNGIYGGELVVDSVRWFDFAFDRIPFEETEYLNALTDYADWTENTSWFHRFWALTPQQFMARPQGSDGARPQGAGEGAPRAVRGNPSFRLRAGPQPVQMTVRDHAGNVSTLEFVIELLELGRRGDGARPHQYFLPAGEASIIDNGALRLELDSTALYRDCFFTYARLPDASAGYFSDVHQLHTPTTPLHGRARLAIRPVRPVPDSLRAKTFLGTCGPAGRWTTYGGTWTDDGRLQTSIPTFGDYAIFLDTIPPTVEVHNFPLDLRRRGGFSVEMTDNVAGGRLAYRGTINGEWALLEYDAKYDRLNYAFANGDPGPGEHLFEITVRDGRENVTVWRRRFRR